MVKLATLTFISAFILQSCTGIKTNILKNKSGTNLGIKSNLPPKFQNFDRTSYPKEAFVVANMISVVRPELDEDDRDEIAKQVSKAIKRYKVEPQIVVAIIDTESNFEADKVSSTGDVSVAQINAEIWNKEFIRMNKNPIDKDKLITDQQYAIMKMGEILHILKKRYGKNDQKWYARYHSNSRKHKSDYLHRLEKRLIMLATATDLNKRIAEN